jgi:hypothetical protein
MAHIPATISTMLSELLTSPAELWYTAVPMVLCLVGVEFFFRNVLTIAWLGTKVAIAGLVYIQVREAVKESFGKDPLCIESRLFGVPPGTINAVALLGIHVAKKRVLSGIGSVCPNCVKSLPPPPPPPPAVAESETWVGWISDIVSL